MGQRKDRAPPKLSEDGRARAAAREERRAQALRDNLKRRKAQSQGRAAAPAERAESPDTAGTDTAGTDAAGTDAAGTDAAGTDAAGADGEGRTR